MTASDALDCLKSFVKSAKALGMFSEAAIQEAEEAIRSLACATEGL